MYRCLKEKLLIFLASAVYTYVFKLYFQLWENLPPELSPMGHWEGGSEEVKYRLDDLVKIIIVCPNSNGNTSCWWLDKRKLSVNVNKFEEDNHTSAYYIVYVLTFILLK